MFGNGELVDKLVYAFVLAAILLLFTNQLHSRAVDILVALFVVVFFRFRTQTQLNATDHQLKQQGILWFTEQLSINLNVWRVSRGYSLFALLFVGVAFICAQCWLKCLHPLHLYFAALTTFFLLRMENATITCTVHQWRWLTACSSHARTHTQSKHDISFIQMCFV